MKLSDKIKNEIDNKYPEYTEEDGYLRGLEKHLSEIEKLEAEKEELISFLKKIKYDLNMICYDTSVLEKVNILWKLIFDMEDKVESWDQITKEN